MITPFNLRFSSSAYTPDTLAYGQLINLVPQTSDSTNYLSSIAGCINYYDYPNQTIRGMFNILSLRKVLCVVGGSLYILDGASSLFISNLKTSDGQVCFAENFTQVMISDDVSGYILDKSTLELASVSSDSFTSTRSLTYLNGYYIAVVTNSAKVLYSNIQDGSVWDDTSFFLTEMSADSTVAITTDRAYLIALCETSIQYFTMSGDSTAPFTPMLTATIPIGCLRPSTVQSSDAGIFFIGSTYGSENALYILRNFQYIRLSTAGIELLINRYIYVSAVVKSFIIDYAGALQYILYMSACDTTLVYDWYTRLWHERQSVIDNKMTAWRYHTGIHYRDKFLVGDITGRIAIYNDSYSTDCGDVIPKIFQPPPLVSRENVRISDVTISGTLHNDDLYDVEYDSKIWLSIKDFEAYPINLSTGGQGYGNYLYKWSSLGQYKTFTPRIVIQDRYRVTITDMAANVA